MPANAPPRKPYTLPIEIEQRGIHLPAGAVVELLPRQIVQIEAAARATGRLPTED